MEYRPSHFGICVSDLERSLRFYCEGLGFTVGQRHAFGSSEVNDLAVALELESEGPVKLVCQFIRSGDMVVELLGYESPPPTGRPSSSRGQVGFTHLSFGVDDVTEAAAHLVSLGATLFEETRHNPGADLVFMADPDGVRIELVQM